MRRLLLLLCAIAGLLLILLALFPATWLDHGLQRASGGNLMLAEAEGTVWRGSGVLQAILPRGEAVTLAPVQWRLAAGELLAGRAHLTVLSQQDNKPLLDAVLHPGGARIQAARLELPADLLGAYSPTLRQAELAGLLSFHAADLSIADGRIAGRAELLWRQAASGLTQVRPLGSYRIAFTGAGERLDFSLATLQGDLNLSGQGSWRPGGGVDFQGLARPVGDKLHDLIPLLRVLGRQTAPGSYRLEIDPHVGAL